MHRNIFIGLIFASLLSGCATGYQVVENKVVYKTVDEGRGTVLQPVSADAKTFEVLGNDNARWARDAGYVFYKGTLVVGVDPGTFVVLDKYYGKDLLNAVSGCKIIKDANVDSFVALENKIKDSNLPAFAKDITRAYYFSGPRCASIKAFEHADYESFEALTFRYARDYEFVYYIDRKLEGANPSTVKVLNGNYITDGKHIYFRGKIVAEADADSFRVTGWHTGRDKNQKYKWEYTFERWCKKYGKKIKTCEAYN